MAPLARPFVTKIRLFADLLLLTLMVGLLVILLSLRGILKRSILSTLAEQFQSQVQVDDLQVAIFPSVSAAAKGIVLRFNGRTDLPPLITIQKLTLSANILNLLRRHVSSVRLDGLQIHIPPSQAGGRAISTGKLRKRIHFPLVIDRIDADDALLETLPRDPKHVPRDFQIHRLTLHSVSFEEPASFHATLTNPVPNGEIDSEGLFGPWEGEDPGNSPLSGDFRYSNVDFSSIRGLSGTMSSKGKYQGTLDQINVEGDTEMPNFALAFAGNPMPLKTHYTAVVDGTNGNTYLKSVEALLGNSRFKVSGEIVGIPGIRGRQITLDATSLDARAEDLLGLTVKGGSPLEGSIKFHATIDLPPKPEGSDLIDRLSLNGQVGLGNARFTNREAQKKIDSLSRAAQGQPKDEDIQDVIANLSCRFTTAHALVTLSDLKFDVSGASLRLDGSYNMKTEELNFRGRLNMDAKLSQTTTGVKSFFLRLANPLFSKAGGGSSIPIAITGSRSKPHFSLDLHGKTKSQAQPRG